MGNSLSKLVDTNAQNNAERVNAILRDNEIIFKLEFPNASPSQVFLDQGDERVGWTHIWNGKAQSFAAKGLGTQESVKTAIKDAVEDPTFVYTNRTNRENAFEVYARRGAWIMKVIVNRVSGRIVTAMPVAGTDGDYTEQMDALQTKIAELVASVGMLSPWQRVRLASLQHLMADFLGLAK